MHSEAQVIAIDAGDAWVKIPERASACGSCSSASTCHESQTQNVLNSSSGPRRIKISNTIGAQVGDVVNLTVADGRVLRASILSYLLPALLAIAGAILGQSITGDIGAIAGTLIGLALGFANLRWQSGRLRAVSSVLSMERPTKSGLCHSSES
jgi:sigma-E factor negative regulatory protein RseC